MNIQFLGFSREEYEEAKPKVDEVLKQIGFADSAVTSFYTYSLVESCDGKRTRMPYLHIFSNEEQFFKIRQAFIRNQLFFDIESLAGSFITAAEMERQYKELQE